MGLTSTVRVVLGVFEPAELQEKRSFFSEVTMPSCLSGHVDHSAKTGDHCRKCGSVIDVNKKVTSKQYELPDEIYRNHAFTCGDNNQLGRVVIGVLLQRIDPESETGAWELDLTQEVMKQCVAYLWSHGITERPKLYLVSEQR